MSETKTLDKTGNPAPLGLLAFGMTTVLLNFHNAGLYPLDSMILAMGLFYGGFAQIIAGLMEWKKGNTFAFTAFVSYGSFWLTLVALVLMPKTQLGILAPAAGGAMSAYLMMWGIFTLFLFFGTLRISKALQIVFGLLVVLFFLLAISEATGSATLKSLAGVEGVVCGLVAIYAGMAAVLNEVYGKTVMPLGLVGKKK